MPTRPALRRVAGSLLVAGLAACATGTDPSQPDGSIGETVEALQPASKEARDQADRADPLSRANFWAREHQKMPGDLDTTLRFAESLRAIQSHERAGQVAAEATVLHPDSADLYLLLGRALAAHGKAESAVRALIEAVRLDPGRADANAALGLAMDRIGQHRTAQEAYRAALEIEPERVATRSNLGLSLTLSGDLDAAESVLTEAAAMPGASVQVRQNLALVYGLQGRFDAMAEISHDAPEHLVSANAALLRRMLGLPGEGPLDPAEMAARAGTHPPGEIPAAAPTTQIQSTPLDGAPAGETPPPARAADARPALRGGQPSGG